MNNAEPLTMQDEIKFGMSRLKPVPKNAEKKPVKVTPISNAPQMQMALKMQSQMAESSENEDDE